MLHKISAKISNFDELGVVGVAKKVEIISPNQRSAFRHRVELLNVVAIEEHGSDVVREVRDANVPRREVGHDCATRVGGKARHEVEDSLVRVVSQLLKARRFGSILSEN